MEWDEKMVSVIIPVYQSKNYIAHCLESVINQTYQNVEIILVDDGSDDGSGAVCDAYAHQYDNVFCIHQENKGVSAARNAGIDSAKGEYILFVDSDDYIASDYLESAVSRFENENPDMYLCGYQSVRKNGKIGDRIYYPYMDDAILQRDELDSVVMKLFRSSVLHAIGTKVYKKSLIKKYGIRFCEKWMYYEDIYFCLSYLLHCSKICIEKRVMYYYQRDICNSLSKQNRNYKYESIYKTYMLLYRFIDRNRMDNEEKKWFYMSYLRQIHFYLDSKGRTERRYTLNARKRYQRLSADELYKDAVSYASNVEKTEYICAKGGFFFAAYLLRKYWLYEG